jgi:hypothetical protein
MNKNTCIECHACCGAGGFAISELQKLKEDACHHLVSGCCAIYERRPGRCRDFLCLYVTEDGQGLLPEQRPDRCGVIMHGARTFYRGKEVPGAPLAVATEVRPGALDNPWAILMIEQVAATRAVLIKRLDGTTKLIGPPEIVNALKLVDIE